jgi:hypothetical protein
MSTLNPNAISRLVQGIQFFQNFYLGRESPLFAADKSWPMVKLPDEFFRCRSPTGPLFTILLSAYTYKAKQSNWRQFDFQSKNRIQDNLQLLRHIEDDLIRSGKLIRPIVYLDASIPSPMKEQLRYNLHQYGGREVFSIHNPDKSMQPTHIICYDAEEHDSEDTLQQETHMGDMVQKQFLRTIQVVDPSIKKSTGIIETNMQESKKKGGKVKKNQLANITFEHPMAFVHWWYWPASADEWMPAADVAGPDTDKPPRPDGGPWVVGCKFIRDVSLFNEWGTEADYAVNDFEKKLSCWKELEQMLLEQRNTMEETKPVNTAVKLRLSIPKEKIITKKFVKRKSESVGMQPRQVFTGYYSENGSKIRRTVFDGALHIPPATVHLVREAIKFGGGEISDISTFSEHLPSIGNILRPSEDPVIANNFLVTELRAGNAGSTLVTARRMVLSNAALAQRIRGGGNDAEMKDYASEKDETTVKNEGISLSDGIASVPQNISSSGALDSKMNVATKEMNITPAKEQKETNPVGPKAITLSSKDIFSHSVSLSGDQEPTTAFPDWYESKSVSSYEQKFLPEWFNSSASHRTESSYITTRENILNEARKSSTKFLTSTSIRRCIPGDVGSLTRLFEFLMSHGFINGSAINETSPCPNISGMTASGEWSDEQLLSLAAAIKQHSTSDTDKEPSINWDAVAKTVRHKMTARDCYEKFLNADFSLIKNELLIQTESRESNDHLYSSLTENVHPDAMKKIVETALQCTDGSLISAQKVGNIGIVASKAYEYAREEEETTHRLLHEILDQRMAKLENRLSLLDDLEGILEAERMVIELERRDLYTNRCRHWFTGNS